MTRYDAIVIGAGLAGLTAACHLARANKKTLLVAGGVGALLLASGSIDVLGYQPAASSTPIDAPLDHLLAFRAEHPDHPYHFLGAESLRNSLDAFSRLLAAANLDYRGDVAHNWWLPSPAGAIHPCMLAPASLAAGDLHRAGRLLIVGFKELRDFYPAYLSHNLNTQALNVQATSLVINTPAPLQGKLETTPIELAHAFEESAFRQAIIEAVAPAANDQDRVGFPAVLGLADHSTVLADLSERLGRPVFEISTLPPSVPGRRLFDALKTIFQQAGGRLIMGSKVLDGEIKARRVTQIRYETAARPKMIQADHYVLATGGLFSGGISTNHAGEISETIFNLPVMGSNNRQDWFEPAFMTSEGQPINRYGIWVNPQLNPLDSDGQVVAGNLYVTGAMLAGTNWTRGRTGDGVAIASATRAANQIIAATSS